MKRALAYCIVLFSFLCMSCEEEDVAEGGVSAPGVELRGVTANQLSFAVNFEEDALNGRFYYITQTSDKASLTAEELKASPYATSYDVNGSDFRKYSMPGLAPKTEYTLYALVAVGDQLSKMVTLTFTTE